MERLTALPALRDAIARRRGDGERIGLVPTMGALHGGHLEHVHRLRREVNVVVVSIFVNPTQFAPGEDLDSYPRDLEGDEQLLGGAADLVWAPPVDVMYPDGPPPTTIRVAGLTEVLEGAHRPGHFDGVCTVVTKLLNQVQPHVVTFGRKDFQQLAVVRRMLTDLDVPVRILEIPTVREDDGLALSSRNRYLERSDRAAARTLSQALRRAVVSARDARAEGTGPTAGALEEVVLATLREEPRVRVDYVAAVEPATLSTPEDGASERLLVAVAAHVGPARLIDNVVVGDLEDEERLLAATRS